MATFRQYSMQAATAVAIQAAQDIEAYLRKLPQTTDVINVENDLAYRTKDIDLLWFLKRANGSFAAVTIEIKGDRYYHTGNYFLETVSNESKKSPGCFLYTEADFVFYYFVKEKELHILPMPGTREWFWLHLNQFREKRTSTPVSSSASYVTVGRLVPRELVLKEVPGVRIIKL